MTQSPDDPPTTFPTTGGPARSPARPSTPSSTATATNSEQAPIFGTSDHNSGPAFPGGDPLPRTGPRPGGLSPVVKLLICGALVAVAAVGAVVILGGGSDGDSASGPEGAVSNFFDAAKDKDCDRMLGLVTEASWSQAGTLDKQAALDQCADSVDSSDFFPGQADITETKILDESADKATVEVTTEIGDADPITETLTVVKEDGNWVVDFNAPAVTDEPAG